MNITELTTRRTLAATYRLLHHFDLDELVYTHTSARIPGTDCYLINQYGLLFNEVTASNLVKIDMANTTSHPQIANTAGITIHGAVYQARPDVQCIIHTHTPAGVAVSADRHGLLPISQSAMIAGTSLAYHDYQGIAIDHAERVSLQNDLGDKRCMILRNHGLLAVGNSVGQAFLTMHNLESACRIQVLVNKNTMLMPESGVLEKFPSTLHAFREQNEWTLAWSALLRLADKLYPDYKE